MGGVYDARTGTVEGRPPRAPPRRSVLEDGGVTYACPPERVGMRGYSEKQAILIAEDEPAISDFLERGLRALGFKIDTAADGIEAERKALTCAVDLVLLDVMLPGRDGLAVLRAIRRDKPELPVLLMTARGTDEDIRAELDHGPTGYLPKPFSFDELVALIKSLLAPAAERHSSQQRAPGA